MSVGFRQSSSGYIDPSQLIGAEKDIAEHVEVNQDHDVPFCAGCATPNEDGKICVYIDKDLDLEKDGVDRKPSLLVHEVVEHVLMKYLGMKYTQAHAIATAAEEACVKAEGRSLTQHNELWDQDVRSTASKAKFDNVPEDLDTEPYQDDPDDEDKKEDPTYGKTVMHIAMGNT
jgi:hypothetical protein